jgi:two-component sensor histidine kinase
MSLSAGSLFLPVAPRTAIQDASAAAHLEAVCRALVRTMAPPGQPPRLHVAIEPVDLPAAAVRSLGLLVAELVANALQHGFPPQDGSTAARPAEIWVTGTHGPDSSYRLAVEDNGIGLPPGFDLRLRPAGRGLRMVTVLADRLRARLAVDEEAGTRFTLRLIPALID